MNQTTYDELIRAIAANLEWEIGSHLERKLIKNEKFIRQDHYEIQFEIVNERRMKVTGIMTDFIDNQGVDKDMIINISLNLSANTIAKELMNSFINSYKQWLDDAIAKRRKSQKYEAEKKDFTIKMLDKLGMTTNSEQTCFGSLPGTEIDIEAHFSPTSSSIQLRFLTALQLEALIETLNKLKPSHSITPEKILGILGYGDQSKFWVDYAGENNFSLRFGFRDNREPEEYNAKIEEAIATLSSQGIRCDRTKPSTLLSHGIIYQD